MVVVVVAAGLAEDSTEFWTAAETTVAIVDCCDVDDDVAVGAAVASETVTDLVSGCCD